MRFLASKQRAEEDRQTNGRLSSFIERKWRIRYVLFGCPTLISKWRDVPTRKWRWSVREKAGVSGRWQDSRHIPITDHAEGGAGDETIRDFAGHICQHMLEALLCYPHGGETRGMKRSSPSQSRRRLEHRCPSGGGGDPRGWAH